MTGIKSQRIKAGPANADSLARRLIGSSPATAAVRQLILKVAPSESTVLLLGESGTGKEVIARAVHECSTRASGPFIPVNCGAIPGELLESELFGHEKGAFTGAISARKGRFEMAENGTLFLDEIGDMPLEMQVKLLRVLQERSFERVGGTKTIKCNVRIIAATHQHLEQKVAQGSFRMDLFYRLNVFPIEVAPLRERADDIEALVSRFVKTFETEQRVSVRLMPDAIAHLKRHPWPGNVRELGNLVERLTILFPNEDVYAADLPPKYQAEALGIAPRPDAPTLPETDDLFSLAAASDAEQLAQSGINPPAGAEHPRDAGAAPDDLAAASLVEGPVEGRVEGPVEGRVQDHVQGQLARSAAQPAAAINPQAEDLSELYAPPPLFSAEAAFPYSNAFADGGEGAAAPWLPSAPVTLDEPIDLKAHLVEVERALIMAALHKTEWINAQAAKLLGLQRTTLVEKMRKYDIQRSDFTP